MSEIRNMLDAIVRPTLLVRENICRNNIKKMADKAMSSGVIFRPHFKTHQSVVVGEWFRDEGIDKITVSSAGMAMKFADAGWNDITIAFPANIREIDIYNFLAKKIKLKVMLDSSEVVGFLSDKLEHSVEIFIEVDCGYGRSGIPYTDRPEIDNIIGMIKVSDNLKFAGFLTHDGNTYQAGTKQEIIDIHNNTTDRLGKLKASHPDAMISVGDTPACSILDDLNGADEIRPGNFIYYDLMQENIGSCGMKDIAVTVACPVTGIYPIRNEIVIYGGAIHLSKEYLGEKERCYGLVVRYTDGGWSAPIQATKVVTLSQEHGVIRTTAEFIQTLKHGDLLGILPVHSCLTANLLHGNTLFI